MSDTALSELAAASTRLAATSSRSAKRAIVADVVKQLGPTEIPVVVGVLTGRPRQGRIGVGWATLRLADVPAAATSRLTVMDLDRAIDRLVALSGDGSVAGRRATLVAFMEQASRAEQELVWRVLTGEIRHGALDGVVTDAVAEAAGVPLARVRRAVMMAGDLGVVAVAALTGGLSALEAIDLQPGRAVQPMLASPAADVADAIASVGSASVEWKLDGARLQAHRRDGDIRLYTRNLNDVTSRLPHVVDLVAALPGGDLVLDGEALGVDDDSGRPQRFQDTMGQFGRRSGSSEPPASGRGLGVYFFDALYADGASLVDEPLQLRGEVLRAVVPEASRLPAITTESTTEAQAFLDAAIEAGHEGVMVKSTSSTYDAGRRGGQWRKVKPVHTLDLVVIAVEWGHGRRTGLLSNLHLGALRGDGAFVMVGKTFKGLTDELLRWQTDALRRLAIGDTDGHVVHVRPDLVVEIALDGVQVSRRYPGGVALRFARVRRYRTDKRATEADTIETVQALLHR